MSEVPAGASSLGLVGCVRHHMDRASQVLAHI